MPRKRTIPRSQLYERTLELLRNRPRTLTLPTIEKETNLPVHWLASLAQGTIDGADVNRIVLLYQYLSGKQLIL